MASTLQTLAIFCSDGVTAAGVAKPDIDTSYPLASLDCLLRISD